MATTSAVNTTAALLARSAFFKGLSEYDCRELARRCARRRITKRECLFLEGTPGVSMYLLTEGNVQLAKTGAEGREVVVRTLKPGDVFAEVVLQAESRYPVTATALTDVTAIEIHRADIDALLDNRRFRNDFIAFLMKKQRYLADRVQYLTSYDVEERFRRFLKEQFGERRNYQIPLSKKDVAAAIGATPETLSRLIQRLADRRLMEWKGRRVMVAPEFWDLRDLQETT